MRLLLKQDGFTLMEVVVVIIILGIIAGIAMRSLDKSLDTAKVESTKAEMEQLLFAVSGNPDLYSNGIRSDFGYVGDVGAIPPDLDALASNPGYGTWNGPYISAEFAEASSEFKRDGWGDLYSYDGLTISSDGGGGGTLTRRICNSSSELLLNTVTGSITDAAGNPPGDSSASVRIIVTYPNGAGSMKDSAVTVSAGGAFTYSNVVPIGNHLIRAVHLTRLDTVQSYISVTPNTTTYANLRFPGAIWASSGTGGTEESTGSIDYVSGSAQCPGSWNDEIRFQIENSSDESVSLTWMIIEYDHTPTAYFQSVRFGGTTVFNSSSPRAESGDTLSFSSTQNLNPHTPRTVRIEDFRDSAFGGGMRVDMSSTEINITFSDGSVITFDSGT